jgi:hypothetical protein
MLARRQEKTGFSPAPLILQILFQRPQPALPHLASKIFPGNLSILELGPGQMKNHFASKLLADPLIQAALQIRDGFLPSSPGTAHYQKSPARRVKDFPIHYLANSVRYQGRNRRNLERPAAQPFRRTPRSGNGLENIALDSREVALDRDPFFRPAAVLRNSSQPDISRPDNLFPGHVRVSSNYVSKPSNSIRSKLASFALTSVQVGCDFDWRLTMFLLDSTDPAALPAATADPRNLCDLLDLRC